MSGLQSNLNGFGLLKSGTIADPGAGNQFTIPVAAGEVWEVLFVGFTYNPNNSGADRVVQVQYNVDGVTALAVNGLKQVTTVTIIYNFMRSIQSFFSAGTGGPPLTGVLNVTFPMPVIYMDGDNGDNITSQIQQLDALDVISDVKYYVRYWNK